ncbi:MAG: Omp28 family outer membrane lipoprotein [Bacteroidia bacterium]|nr:Omp28 family outer membrane lipoprotein [Bacteroidia bacterium]
MKNLKQYLLLFSYLFVVSACDEIDGPYGGSSGNVIPTDSVVRKVLIEDFTGHTCQACPNAHRKASDLLNTYGERLVVIAVHADFWADPYPPTAPYFTYDFRTPLATQIATDFGVIGQPFPKGMVNRMLNPGTNDPQILDWAAWAPKLSEWYALPADAGLEITPTYDAGSRTITAEVDVKVVDNLVNPAKLAVYFIEDSIIQWQKDGTSNVQNYVHNHVLRGSLNGAYGEDLGTLNAGDEISKTYSNSLVPNDAVPEKIKLVAILSDAVTKEVIQVEEVDLLP